MKVKQSGKKERRKVSLAEMKDVGERKRLKIGI